jgi:short subunit dehydrogenase-like uncharacterized protein
MAGRVICFGATGFTGRLTAEVMVRAGMAPLLAGRSAEALVDLTGELAGLGPIDRPPTWQVADAQDPDSVRALLTSPDDVLVTTVGPFLRFGSAAVEAAIDAGCGYVDSTGEPTFIRRVFEQDGPAAERTGARLLTAFGYDYVPGNLAAAHAIDDARRAGRVPSVVEVGYFVRGAMHMSSGTRASIAGMVDAPPFALRNGVIAATRGEIITFDVEGREWQAMPVGGTEHFTLPRVDSDVRDVHVGLGWAGKWTKAAHAAAGAVNAAASMPGVGGLVRSGIERVSGEETGIGPDAATRRESSTLVVARTRDGVGRELSHVVVTGPSPYDLTAELLAWGAAMLLNGRARGAGALGPVDAFGMDDFVEGCARMGLHRVD